MVPADSARISRVPAYSGAVWSARDDFAYGAFTLYGAAFQRPRLSSRTPTGDGPSTPAAPKRPRFGLLRVRSPLLAQSLLLSLPRGTEMFQFPRFAPRSARCRDPSLRVAPFGHRRIIAHLPLPAAFRSLSRPSSPPRAKASFMCPSLLSLFLRLQARCPQLGIRGLLRFFVLTRFFCFFVACDLLVLGNGLPLPASIMSMSFLSAAPRKRGA